MKSYTDPTPIPLPDWECQRTLKPGTIVEHLDGGTFRLAVQMTVGVSARQPTNRTNLRQAKSIVSGRALFYVQGVEDET